MVIVCVRYVGLYNFSLYLHRNKNGLCACALIMFGAPKPIFSVVTRLLQLNCR
jgi:hypothetical protein